MQKFAFFLLSLLFSSQLLTAQWAPLPQHTGYHANNISFGTASSGWMLATSNQSPSQVTQLFRTTDGGNSWQPSTTVPFGANPYPMSVHALSANTAHVFIRQSGSTIGLASKVFRTTDAGATWSDITPDSTELGMGTGAVYFTDANTGLVGVGATMYRTTNGGQSWTQLGMPLSSGVYPTKISGKGSRIAVSGWDGTFGYEGIFMLSTDAGATWDTIPLNRYNTTLQGAVYPAPDTVFGVTGAYSFGPAPEFYRSFDGGITFDTLFLQFVIDSFTTPVDIHFTNGTHGTMVLQNGQIMETTDAGLNWTEVFHAHNSLITMAFWGGNGWVGGDNGYLASITGANSVQPGHLSPPMNLFPNPSRGEVYIQLPENWHQADISVFDTQGKVVATKTVNHGTQALNLEHLPKGMYWVKAQHLQQVSVQKLVHQ